jgi:three-Cys-motif partner protein
MKFIIDFWAVEKKRSNFQALEFEIAHRRLEDDFPGLIHLRHGTFQKPLLEALQKLKSVRGGSGRSIFIFDQTGYGQVDLEIIRNIFAMFERPEVILTFAVSWLADLARADADFLKRVASLGIREGELRELLEAKEDWSPRYGAQKWLRSYIQKYVGAPHDTSFFLHSEESHKDLWLLHFSRQPRARDAMLEVHYKFANQAHFYGKEGFEMLGYNPTIDDNQCRLFGFTDQDASRSTDALLDDIPKAMTDRGGSAGIPAQALFARELNDATVTFEMFKKGAVAARSAGLVEIYTAEGRLRPAAKQISRDDVLKLPSQSTIWQLLK